MREKQSVRRRLDLNRDGVVDERDIAAGLDELFSHEARGRLEQHVLVPFAKAAFMGLGIGCATYALMWFMLNYTPALIRTPMVLAKDTALTVGFIVFGVWLAGEMWVSTAKPIKNAKDESYQDGVDDTDMKWAAEVSRLNDALAAASSKKNVAQGVQLSDTENQFVTKGQVFLNFLWDAHSRTSKASFVKYEGVSQPMWGRIRDRFVALSIVDTDRNILVERVDAQQTWATHVEKIKTTRERGATPVL